MLGPSLRMRKKIEYPPLGDEGGSEFDPGLVRYFCED